MHREDLLRKWLRGKQVHPADIAATLTWYEAESAVGRVPSDDAVLRKADEFHAQAVGQYRPIAPHQVVVNHKWTWSWKVAASALLGALIGGALNAWIWG